ncbi:conserved hypothetical protein [Trichinella spiralis]|uniref:hypothetical protein n=1 Tax=Trichinella spiralis TaxID=6334 RepID=UPI0001EFCA49|nr:conserved hypothetical protein [Trichinella spiralis]
MHSATVAVKVTLNVPNVVPNRITNVTQIIDHFIEQDFVHELQRSSKASRDVLEIISCYQEIQHERKRKELNQNVKRSRLVQRKVTITAE